MPSVSLSVERDYEEHAPGSGFGLAGESELTSTSSGPIDPKYTSSPVCSPVFESIER